MTDIVDSIDAWDRCYPGNLNIEVLVDDAKIEITRLRQLLSEAEQREREARAKALEEAAQVAEKTGPDSENDWPGETWIASRIASAIRALQSEER